MKQSSMVHIIGHEVAFVWLAMSTDNDLEPDRLAVPAVYSADLVEHDESESIPFTMLNDWVDEDVRSVGWGDLFDHRTHSIDDWWPWMMARGIAPGQPFLVRCHRGYSVECQTMDGTDYDWEQEPAEIVSVAPWSKARSLKAWLVEFAARSTPFRFEPGILKLDDRGFLVRLG